MKQGLRYSEAVATAAVLIGGLLLVFSPLNLLSIIQLTILTAAMATALTAYLDSVPASGWISPFRWLSPFQRARDDRSQDRPDELALIHSRLQGRRSRVKGAPALPPDVVRLLDPLIRDTLDLIPTAESHSGRQWLAPLSEAVLAAKPPLKPSVLLTTPADPAAVSAVVQEVLDDLERVSARARQTRPANPRLSSEP